ncbi:hypothetical protein DsansV1_C11g0107701 [Dioscorea sansibarensis]
MTSISRRHQGDRTAEIVHQSNRIDRRHTKQPPHPPSENHRPTRYQRSHRQIPRSGRQIPYPPRQRRSPPPPPPRHCPPKRKAQSAATPAHHPTLQGETLSQVAQGPPPVLGLWSPAVAPSIEARFPPQGFSSPWQGLESLDLARGNPHRPRKYQGKGLPGASWAPATPTTRRPPHGLAWHSKHPPFPRY